MKINYLLIIALFMTSSDVLAESKDHGNHGHSQEVHVHGVAELTLAMEGNTLEVGIESPSINIVGFEHKANTPDQHQAVAQAEAALKQPKQLFTFSGTRCEIKDVAVDMTGVMHAEEKKDDHHGHEEEHHDHHKEHDKHEEDHETHSEITANYRFSCDDGANLTSVSVELFNRFPGVEKIHAMWVMQAQQAAITLNAEQNIIRLK